MIALVDDPAIFYPWNAQTFEPYQQPHSPHLILEENILTPL